MRVILIIVSYLTFWKNASFSCIHVIFYKHKFYLPGFRKTRAALLVLPNKATFVVARSFDPKLCFVEKIGINFVITGGLFESTN